MLAVLSILVLIAATLSYTAQLEQLSARNYADGIQARMAAATGVSTFFSFQDGRTSGILEPWIPPQAVLGGQTAMPRSGLGSRRPLTGLPGGLGQIQGPPPMLGAGGPGQTPPSAGMPPMNIMPPNMVPPTIASHWSPLTSPTQSLQGRIATEPAEVMIAEQDNLSQIETNLIQMRVVDQSSKVNINALGSWNEVNRTQLAFGAVAQEPIEKSTSTIEIAPPLGLADALYAVLSSPEANYPSASPALAVELARAILKYRYGPDGQPGVAGVDDDNDGPGAPLAPSDSVGISQWNPRGTIMDRTSPRGSPRGRPRTPTGSPGQGDDLETLRADGLDNDYDGVVDEPGECVDEPDEFIADPRLKPYGDDRPFRRVEDLLLVEGMASELYLVLRPHVTVFSASELRIGPGRQAPAPVDLNAATEQEIYRRLRWAFPEVTPEMCAQFTANIVDYRDADSVPYRIDLEGTAEPILGLECTPAITEVWPDSTTETGDGDDGQYIEIHNPYDVPISIEGWSVHIRNASTVNLRGTLLPGAYLIITDDYNESHDPTPEDDASEYGSFYDIFHNVPNHRDRLLVEEPTLDIPDKSGLIELVDQAGNLIDQFKYGGGSASGLTRSYQRSDPRIRSVEVARCTPFRAADQVRTPMGIYAPARVVSSSGIQNAPYRSALELFHISCTYTAPTTDGQGVAQWRTPTIASLEPTVFDERLADMFTVWMDRRAWRDEMRPRRYSFSDGSTSLTAEAVADMMASTLTLCGRININTAPPSLLQALTGITPAQIDYLLVQRATASRFNPVGIPVVYSRWSEFLADNGFWGTAQEDYRLHQAAQWLNSISFDSNSYRLVTENVRERTTGPRLASRSKVEAVVSTDGAKNRVVSWRFLE